MKTIEAIEKTVIHRAKGESDRNFQKLWVICGAETAPTGTLNFGGGPVMRYQITAHYRLCYEQEGKIGPVEHWSTTTTKVLAGKAKFVALNAALDSINTGDYEDLHGLNIQIVSSQESFLEEVEAAMTSNAADWPLMSSKHPVETLRHFNRVETVLISEEDARILQNEKTQRAVIK